MKREFKPKCIDVSTTGLKIAVMNKEDAEEMDLNGMDRIGITAGDKECTAVLDLTEEFVKKGEIGLFKEIPGKLGKCPERVTVKPKEKPSSIKFIKDKLDGEELKENEINQIITDLMEERLTNVELTGWISANYIRGLSEPETITLTKAIVNSGETIQMDGKKILDKHCIGGVPGNRTTPLIVSIVAAAGLTIPKTSSRAITSPAGTADAMEVMCNVEIEKERVEEIVEQTGACMTGGRLVNLAAADDKLIRIRHPLSLDPRGMLLASILAKKKAVGAEKVIIDIPIGEGAKIKSKEEAKDLAGDFDQLGDALDMDVHCLITDGDHPIGCAIGPALEAIEVLKILRGDDVSPELKEKSLRLAGILLELGGKAGEGKGWIEAKNILESKKAYEKFKEIIKAQDGDPEIKPEDIEVGDVTKTVKAEKSGKISHIDNKGIAKVAKLAGAPKEKGAGMYLKVEEGEKIKEGQELFMLYADSERKIEEALEAYEDRNPIEFSKIILEELA